MRTLAPFTLALAIFLLLVDAGHASRATARYTDDPGVVQVTVHVDLVAKHPMSRKVWALGCRSVPTMGTACIEEEPGLASSKRLRFHRGRNRRTVTLYPQAFIREFVGVAVTGTPWEGLVPMPVPASDTAWWWIGQDRSGQTVPVSPVAHDTLSEGRTP